MNKAEFLDALRARLCGLPDGEVDDRLIFYGEMIDDRMEDGLSEEDAVNDIGTVEDIAQQILTEIPLSKIVKEKIKKKRSLKAWEIVLIALGFPIWFPLLAAAFATVITVYACIWAVVVSLWAAVFVSLSACAVGCVGLSILMLCTGKGVGLFLAILAAALVCAGLSIFAFFGCKSMTKGVIWLTKKTVLGIKNMFVRREAV